MIKKILQKEAKILREIAKDISLKDIKTTKTKKVLKEMKEALASQGDGVAIAAPQIGYSLRVFVVSGKVFEKNFLDNRKGRMSGEKEKNDVIEVKPKIKDLVFINPKISKLSRKKEWVPEGCLSVRPLYGKTWRSKKATVEAYDENGREFTRGASGLLAQIFQHETEHLDGVLFIDHAKDIKAEVLQKK
ncbi:MAG: peptide deformylase [Patescibacteria group bacterium]